MVAFDAVGPSATGTTGTTSPTTWAHTCTGTNRLLIAFLTLDNVTTASSVTATYAGIAMTEIGRRASGGGTVGIIVGFKIINPATGANNVIVTTSAGGSNVRTAGSISFNAADQATGIGTVFMGDSAGGNVTSGSVSVTGTTSGNIVCCGCCSGSGGMAVSGGSTKRFGTNHGSASGGACDTMCETLAAPGGTAVMSWTQNADFWAGIAFQVLDAGGVAASILPQQTKHRFPAAFTRIAGRNSGAVYR